MLLNALVKVLKFLREPRHVTDVINNISTFKVTSITRFNMISEKAHYKSETKTV